MAACVLLGTLGIGVAAAQTQKADTAEPLEVSETPGTTPPPAAVAPTPDASSESTEPDPAADARAAAAGVSIEAVDDRFVPERVTVDQGATLAWANTGANLHTVMADDGSFDSGLLSPGDTFTLSIDEPGTIAYFCSIHGGAGGAGMAGVVTVRAASTPSPSAGGTGTPGGGDGAGDLPATGADAGWLLAAVVIGLVAGAVLVRAGRRTPATERS